MISEEKVLDFIEAHSAMMLMCKECGGTWSATSENTRHGQCKECGFYLCPDCAADIDTCEQCRKKEQLEVVK